MNLKGENRHQAGLNRYYLECASVYDLSMAPHERWVSNKDLLGLLDIKPGMRVLDMGTGTGKNFETMPQEADLIGFDISEVMMARARMRAGELGLLVNFTLGDSRWMPFASDTFDLVLATYSLSACANCEKAMDEAWRVLEPGGLLGILDFPFSACYLKGGVGGINLYALVSSRIDRFKVVWEKSFPDDFLEPERKLMFVLKKLV